MLVPTDSEQKNKVRKISEISEFSYLAQEQIRKLGKFFRVSVVNEIYSLLVACLIGSVFTFLATDSKQE